MLVGGCVAKYIPYNGVADSQVTCLTNFQKILMTSGADASTCGGKTPMWICGVLGLDANNEIVPGNFLRSWTTFNNNLDVSFHCHEYFSTTRWQQGLLALEGFDWEGRPCSFSAKSVGYSSLPSWFLRSDHPLWSRVLRGRLDQRRGGVPP